MRLRTAILLLGSLFVFAGCIVLPGSRTVFFRVVDGDTGAPVPGARADVHYERSYLFLNRPRDRSAVADATGLIRLRAHLYDHGSYAIGADGYVSIYDTAAPDSVLPEHLPRRNEPAAKPCFVAVLYRTPEPTLALALPDGFRGVILVDVTSSDRLALAAGQREFRIPVTAGGYASIEGVPLVARVSRDWTYLGNDGRPVDQRKIRPRPVLALRGVESFRDQATGLFRGHVFIFGTNDEAIAATGLVNELEGSTITGFSVEKFEKLRAAVRAAAKPLTVQEARKAVSR